MLDIDAIDDQYSQVMAMLTQLETGLANEDDRGEALEYLAQTAAEIGGVFTYESVRTRTPDTRDYTDGSGSHRHAATRDTMQDLAVAVRDAAEPSEAALIISTVLTSVADLMQELRVWTGAPARVAATRESNRDGMTRDQVLAYLAAKGRAIKPGTWSAYVTRNQAPQAARKLGRTPLWNPADVAAFADGTWKAPHLD